MSKRERLPEDGERTPKRHRIDTQPPQAEEIHFARQLQDVLVFRQDGIQQLRNGIASFKAFLETVLYHREDDNRGRQISILREYLESQKPADPKDFERPFLSHLWQAWSFAAQNNNDYVVSSVSAILALLVKTLAGILDLREFGVLLCRTVLQGQHLRLVKRGLDAPKHKDFVLSPSLRLLTEVTCFDGGIVAREVYKRREQTFDISSLRRNLGMVKTDLSEEEARRKPAIRTLTLRYILSLFKYLHEGGKIDILKSRPLCNAMFQHIRDDPSESLIELLSVFEKSVLKDSALPRSAKAAILTAQNLERITDIAVRTNHAASEKAFAWLKSVSSIPDYGILRESGWYPPGTADFNPNKQTQLIDLGLDMLEFYDNEGPISIRNPVLLSWSLALRAHTGERERQLLVSCFTAAPELVAAYFSEKTIQLDPKLTNTWIAYASLMFEVVALPIPAHLGNSYDVASLPPQAQIMIESILPKPLSQAVLTRCVNQSSELIRFFAVRILILAFEKLGCVLAQIADRSSSDSQCLWKAAGERLLQRFVDRCPPISAIIATFRKLPDDEGHALQREAIVKLLRLYYQINPSQALEEQFDSSVALTAALIRSEANGTHSNPGIDALKSLELEHLLVIARHSSGIKWFNKQSSLSYSPLVTLLRIHRRSPSNREIRSLLQHILYEHGILELQNKSTEPTPLDALVASTLSLTDDSIVWALLEDCIGRASKKPVKYIDDLEALPVAGNTAEKDSKAYFPSTIAAVILEQAPFIASAVPSDRQEKIVWVGIFLGLLEQTSDRGPVLRRLIKNVTKTKGWTSRSDEQDLALLLNQVRLPEQKENFHPPDGEQRAVQDSTIETDHHFNPPPEETQSRPELLRWSQKDFDLAIENGDIEALIICLCSRQEDVRKQAFIQLNKLKYSLRTDPAQENGAQLSILIGELNESFQQQYMPDNIALPYIAGTFAARALRVLVQPQHFIYPKLNRFLIRGPEWRVERLAGHWLSNTVLNLPEDDDAYWREVQWVLDWLVDGLRTSVDLDIMRKSGAFERAMALGGSPGSVAHKAIFERILELLFRATCIEGGSNTLITRTGVFSWLDMVCKMDLHPNSVTANGVRDRILETCDRDRIAAWSGGKKGLVVDVE